MKIDYSFLYSCNFINEATLTAIVFNTTGNESPVIIIIENRGIYSSSTVSNKSIRKTAAAFIIKKSIQV